LQTLFRRGAPLADGNDAVGQGDLSSLCPALAQLVASKLGYEYHWSVIAFGQRSARHAASKTDSE
jgi:hypothetical protein